MSVNIIICEDYTVKELRDYAKNHNIDLGKLKLKREICDRINNFLKKNLVLDIESSKDEEDNLGLVKYPDVESTIFSGNIKNELLSMIYILRKYKNTCGYIPQYDKTTKLSHAVHSIVWNCERELLLFPPSYFEQLKSCKSRFFYCICTLLTCDGMDQHANCVVYDSVNKSLERFDPQGITNIKYKTEALDVFFFKTMKAYKIKYINQELVCPKFGLQYEQYKQCSSGESKVLSTDPGGFCSAWTIFYIDSKLKNPNIDSKMLVERLIHDLKENLFDMTSYIRNYSAYIISVEKYLDKIDEYKNSNNDTKVLYIINNFSDLISKNESSNESKYSKEELKSIREQREMILKDIEKKKDEEYLEKIRKEAAIIKYDRNRATVPKPKKVSRVTNLKKLTIRDVVHSPEARGWALKGLLNDEVNKEVLDMYYRDYSEERLEEERERLKVFEGTEDD